MELPFHGQLTREEFERINRVMQPLWMRWWMLVLGILLTGVILSTSIDRALPLSVVFALLFGGVQFLVFRKLVRSAWEKTASVRKPLSGVVTEDGISYGLDDGSSSAKYGWKDLVKVKIRDDFALLFIGPGLSFILMSRFFASSDDWTRFKEMVNAHHG